MKYFLTITWSAAVAAMLVGCKPTMPEANRENCQPATVVQLDRSIRSEFVDKCLRG